MLTPLGDGTVGMAHESDCLCEDPTPARSAHGSGRACCGSIRTVWGEANDRERRVLVEDLLDAVYGDPGHLQVVARGAPPLKVELPEVGLRPPAGMGTLVSEVGV